MATGASHVRGSDFLAAYGAAARESRASLRAVLAQVKEVRSIEENGWLSEAAFASLVELKTGLYREHFAILQSERRGDERVFDQALGCLNVFAAAEHEAGHRTPSALRVLRAWTPVCEFLSAQQQRVLLLEVSALFPEAVLDDSEEAVLDDSEEASDVEESFAQLLFGVCTNFARNGEQDRERFCELVREEPGLLIDNWAIVTKLMKSQTFTRMVIEGMGAIEDAEPEMFDEWMNVLQRIHEVNFGPRLHPMFVRSLQGPGSRFRDIPLFTSDIQALKRGGFRERPS